jgi:glycosyltransferase involved in cell wall biosynthesis
MMLGSDVSGCQPPRPRLPLYNEAAGLAFLNERLGGLARTHRQRYGLACEVVYVDDGSADATLGIARGLAADALDIQVVSLLRNSARKPR